MELGSASLPAGVVLAVVMPLMLVLGVLLWRQTTLERRLGGRLEDTARDELAWQQREVSEQISNAFERQHDRIHAVESALLAQLARQREEVAIRFTELAGRLGQSHEHLRGELLEQVLTTLASHARTDRELLQDGLQAASGQLTQATDRLSGMLNERLETIAGHVNQRLDEGFRKTNETFASVMSRLATIDEAQKKIDGLTRNVVSLQELLGDKRARGAFGEVQLEGLVRNMLSPTAFSFQHVLSNGTRADCMLELPAPSGRVCVDSKFPLENYHRMHDESLADSDRRAARALFRADVRRHIEAIAEKYIVPGETSDGAVMFIPAEAVFAEIHAYHPELVALAQGKRVWVVSPTTLMAVLNTARAVLRDVETREQVHVIQDALARLASDFRRFDERMAALARHIEQAGKDVRDVQVSSRKISAQFERIESARLDELPEEQPDALPPRE